MEKEQKTKKKIKDSIAISKGYHKIHQILMGWRRNLYILILLEVFISLTFEAFQIYFLVNGLEKVSLCWALIFLVLKINKNLYLFFVDWFSSNFNNI